MEKKKDGLEGVFFFFFLQIPSSRKVFPQPCFVPVSPSIHAHLLSALSSFTTTNTLTLFILLGLHSYYLQAGTDRISFGLEFPFHRLHLCQHSRHRSSKEPLLRVTEFPHVSFLTFRRPPRTPCPRLPRRLCSLSLIADMALLRLPRSAALPSIHGLLLTKA